MGADKKWYTIRLVFDKPGEHRVYIGISAMDKVLPFDTAAWIRNTMKAKGYDLEDWWIEEGKQV